MIHFKLIWHEIHLNTVSEIAPKSLKLLTQPTSIVRIHSFGIRSYIS